MQYSYDDKSVVAVNTTSQPQHLKLTALVYDINLAEKFSKITDLDLAADSNFKAFAIPQIQDLSSTYFLKLTLQDKNGLTVSSNFYWLSTKDDVLDWRKPKWYYTPTSSYADMSQLEKLPVVKLSVSGDAARKGDNEIAHITMSNPTRSLAFFIHLQIKKGSNGREVLPIVWQDNYFSLLPGEKRDISASYKTKDLAKAAPFLSVEGWNTSPLLIPIPSITKH